MVPRSCPPARLITSKRTTLLKEQKLSVESQEQILCIEYNIVCMLAHDGPQTCCKAKIPPSSSYVPSTSQLLHFISTESRKYIVELPYVTLKTAVIWRGVSNAHGTAITAISRCVPCVACAYGTPRQATAFVNVTYCNLKCIRVILWR